MSSLSKITVTILITAFFLLASGGIISVFTPGFFAAATSDLPSVLTFIFDVLYFILSEIMLFTLIKTIFERKKGYAAFILCFAALINTIDLLFARPTLSALAGKSFLTVSPEEWVTLLVRLHFTVMISAISALLLGAFKQNRSAAGMYLAVLTSLCTISNTVFWVRFVQSAMAYFLRGDFKTAFTLVFGNMAIESGAALAVSGVALISVGCAVASKKKAKKAT